MSKQNNKKDYDGALNRKFRRIFTLQPKNPRQGSHALRKNTLDVFVEVFFYICKKIENAYIYSWWGYCLKEKAGSRIADS